MTHTLVCPRRKVSEVAHHLPAKYLEAMEQNQLAKSCCRHPENHEVEAYDSRPGLLNSPDIYIFHCSCGAKHRRFCVDRGVPTERPKWD